MMSAQFELVAASTAKEEYTSRGESLKSGNIESTFSRTQESENPMWPQEEDALLLTADAVDDHPLRHLDSIPEEPEGSAETEEASDFSKNEAPKTDSSIGNGAYMNKWGSSSVENNQAEDNAAANPDAGVEEDNDFSDSDEDRDDEEDSRFFAENLPPFADETSKALHRETKRLEVMREEAEMEAKEHAARISIMTEHIKNLQQEIEHTNKFVAAKKKEVQTEEHLVDLSSRERGRFQKDIAGKEEAIARDRERFKNVENQIFRANEDVDSFKEAVNWNQEELEQWAAAASQKEDDSLALEKYTRADEVKIKDLTLRIEKLTTVSVEKQAQLDNEVTETQSRQVELERIANTFRAHHEERKKLVEQWQETIESMRRRDMEIDERSQKFATVKETLSEQQKQMVERRATLELLSTDTGEVEQEIESAERTVQSRKQEQSSLRVTQLSFKDELEALRAESAASATSLLRKEAECGLGGDELQSKYLHLQASLERCELARGKLEEEKKLTTSKQQSAKEVESFLEERAKELRKAQKNVDALKSQLFRDSQQLSDSRRTEADLIAEIRSSQAMVKNLSSELHSLDGEILRQQELLYNAEFQTQQMERKVARGLGERSDEEKRALLSRINELEDDLKSKRETRANLAQQCSKVQHELRTWHRKKERCDAEQLSIQNEIAETMLEISACETNLKRVVKRKEESMVSHDMMRLDVRRRRDKLSHRADEVFSLEGARHQLLLTIAERKKEVSINNEVKTAQLRASEDERHKIAVEIGQRKIIVEKLQSKYEMLHKAHHSEPTGGKEEHSQVYYLITAAQKREELQREGDKLDSEIRAKEKELGAMEKTLSHLQKRNTAFRSSFAKANMTSPQAEKLKSLENKASMTHEKLLDRKGEFHRLNTDYEAHEQQLMYITLKKEQLQKQNGQLQIRKNQVLEEIDILEKNIKQTKDCMNEMSAQHRKKLCWSTKEEMVQQAALRAEQVSSGSVNVLRTLEQLCSEFPEVKKETFAHLRREGVSMP